MVRKEPLVYLFTGLDIIGEDGSSKKEVVLKSIKNRFLKKDIRDFNLDVLYSRELNLKDLQEKLLYLPLNTKQRIIIIKDLQNLKEDLKRFILGYVRKPYPGIILILDIEKYNPNDTFIKALTRYSRRLHFRETANLDAFTLGRLINLKRPTEALKVLSQLLERGEKPELILGGLRSSWEREIIDPLDRRKRLKLLLDCDIDIKTGRLKPLFALEKLVVGLYGV